MQQISWSYLEMLDTAAVEEDEAIVASIGNPKNVAKLSFVKFNMWGRWFGRGIGLRIEVDLARYPQMNTMDSIADALELEEEKPLCTTKTIHEISFDFTGALISWSATTEGVKVGLTAVVANGGDRARWCAVS